VTEPDARAERSPDPRRERGRAPREGRDADDRVPREHRGRRPGRVPNSTEEDRAGDRHAAGDEQPAEGSDDRLLDQPPGREREDADRYAAVSIRAARVSTESASVCVNMGPSWYSAPITVVTTAPRTASVTWASTTAARESPVPTSTPHR